MNGHDEQNLPLAQPLTPREQEVLVCIGDGKTNRQIAEHLTIAMSTVKWYVRQIYNKLGVENREEGIARARRLGLLPEGRLKHNLPVAPTPFVGRQAELAAMADLIADPQVRLITITGPGGIGKTRLALQAARRELDARPSYSDGFFFVSLAPLEAAAEIVSALAAALNFQFQDSGHEKEQLLNYLRNKRMLLVMDNFEHLLNGRDLLAEINEQATEITLLATSRERLQLRGEQLFPLQGLTLPENARSVEDAPAAQLFLHICRRGLPNFQLLGGDNAALMRICRLVEGMPLGLELAGSWASLLPLPEIAAEIEQSMRLLSSELHDAPPRHRSMQAALDVSWTRLVKEEKRAFQELTVFRGGFTRVAALEVAGASLPILVTLMNKSWLSYDRRKDRYSIHELLRQYGVSKLGADPAHEQLLRDRHCAYFCDFLDERQQDWYGTRQKEVFAEVSGDIDNIQRAWRWAAAKGSYTQLARGLHSLCRFYSFEGRKSDGLSACRAAHRGLEKTSAGGEVGEARYLILMSQVLAWESDFVEEVAERKQLLVRSMDFVESAAAMGYETIAEEAFIHLESAYALGNQDRNAAIQAARQSQALFREVGDLWFEAEATRIIGVNHLFLGAFQEAERMLRASLAIRQELKDQRGIAQATTDLGLAAQHQGKYGEAKTLHRQGLEIYQRLQNLNEEAYTLMVLSFTQSWAGNFEAAGESAQKAFALQGKISGMPSLWGFVALALAQFHLGNYADTRLLAAEAREIAEQRGHLLEKAFALLFLGDIGFIDGDLDTAVTCLAESTSLMAEANYVYQALPRANYCMLLRAQGDGNKARDNLAGALRSCLDYRSTTPIAYCLPVAALLAADDGDYKRSIELNSLGQQYEHIRNSRWFADVACGELDMVRVALPPEVAASAEMRGRKLDVWQTAETLLHELNTRFGA